MLKYGGFSKLDFAVQVAFKEALVTQISFSPALTPKSKADIEKASEKTVRNLHSLYTANASRWNRLEGELKETLNKRFKEFSLKEIPLSFKLPETLKEIQNMKTKESFMPLYEYFDDRRETYQRFALAYKIEFNKKVSEFNLSTLN